MQEPNGLGSVDSEQRLDHINVRPLQPDTAAANEVRAALRGGPEEQTPGQRGFAKGVVIAAEDVADAAVVDIRFDQKTRRQVKAGAAPEQRRFPLLRVRVAEPGAADRAEDEGPRFLCPSWRSGEADNEDKAENPGNQRERHAPECANR
jgi:hypothetical protein